MNNYKTKSVYLLPNKVRAIGVLLILLGVIFSVLRFYSGIKPEFLEIKVFTVFSSFLQTKYLSFIVNNIFEEITGLCILIGLFFIAFSKEKYEDDTVMQIRIYSLFHSIYLNILLTIFSFVFIFGLGFVYYLVLNLFLFLVIFIILFRYKLFINKKL